ncbi:MAG: ribosome recycling factor [Chloroflexi bacterium]|nr:ribosome recycling factor [Chloroflexota bacterium]
MIDDLLVATRKHMDKTIEALNYDLHSFRAGRANPVLLDRLRVDYYGTPTPLTQMSTVTAPEPRLLTIKPWDPKSLNDIERAILKSDLGLMPSNDGKIIRLVIPQLTQDRRQELVKGISKRMEEARVAIRNIRRDVLEELKEYEKEKLISEDDMFVAKDKVQEITDQYIKDIEEIGKAKEAEIMEI